MIRSIDQNCHPLWDAVPKLHALARAGRSATHFVEDVDVAFTALGAEVDQPDLRIARERYHRSGGADWGAAMFYSEFLGKLPVEPRDFEPFTGLSTKALAHKLGISVDELYDATSPGDNWQLIGSSYVGDREHHRVIGDLTAAETEPFLRELLDIATADLQRSFPEDASRHRLDEWLANQRRLAEHLLARHRDRMLVDVYRDWMVACLGEDSRVAMTSELFACGQRDMTGLLKLFLTRYDELSELYNRALTDVDSPLRPLRTDEGELPYFAVLTHQGRLCRVSVRLEDGLLHLAERTVACDDPARLCDALAAAGVHALAPKAVAMVVQVRMGNSAGPLALPHRGSLYVPASHRFAALLLQAGLLTDPLEPILRVRLRLLDRMMALDTPVRLPEHLHADFGADLLAAREVATRWQGLAEGAAQRLQAFRNEAGRTAWQRKACPALVARIDELDRRRRDMAAENPKNPALREISTEVRELERTLLRRTVDRIAADLQLRDLDTWDSRGAIWPACGTRASGWRATTPARRT